MGKGLERARRCLGLVLFALVVPALVQAQTKPEDEYKDLIRVDQDIQPLGDHPFGMDVGLYDGSLSFEQTDVSAAGNGPVLQLVRHFSVKGRGETVGRSFNGAFGDWDLNLPRISTLTAKQGGVNGWEVGSQGNTRRCTHFNRPPSVAAPKGDSGRADWEPATWWHGYHLVIPGQGSQDLLSNSGSDKAAYPAVTKQHWRIGCLASTANGEPGEGFLAQAPDGTRYWFNELVYRWAPTLRRPVFSGPITQSDVPPESLFANRRLLARALGWLTGTSAAQALPQDDFLQRREAWMLVTRIEDRFGNRLDYAYDSLGRLTSISASDGRKLTVQYGSEHGLVSQVTLKTSGSASRVWKYTYTGSSTYLQQLSSVTLPDGRRWTFDLKPLFLDASLDGVGGSCYKIGEPYSLDSRWTGSMVHPSGLKGSFTVKPTKRGRSNVFRECLGVRSGSEKESGSYAVIPNAWYSLSLVQKTFSGAGLSAQTWSYGYSAANESWADECNSSCASTVWTQILNPDGSSIRYTFSNRFDETESRLTRTDYYSGNGAGLLRSEINSYAKPDAGPWPVKVGWNLQERINAKQTEQRTPLSKRAITQDGDTYTWQAKAFNKYAQVTQTRRSNSIAGQQAIEEKVSYRNDTVHWVLGLPEETTNLTTGDVVSVNTYDSATNLLMKRSRFGQLVMQYDWYASGQLKSFTDANGHTTTLSSYKRGIPGVIHYPDGTSQALAVDDFGQITAVTDQAGHTTTYDYDDVGRVSKITWPSDSVAWYPQTFTYQYVTGSERGLGGGHWKRTVSQGEARHVTYYDALLRPVLTDSYISGDSASHRNIRTDYNWKGLTTFTSWAGSGTPALSALGAGTTTRYDALGRVTSVSQPSEQGALTTTTAYPGGARKQVTDPAGHVTTLTYQVFDEPTYDAVVKVQAPESVVQAIVRNLYGNPTKLVQSGPDGQGGSLSLTKYLYYDAQQRLCRTREPETGSTVMAYDAAGNLAWSVEGLAISGNGCGTAASGRTTRSYDAMNRLLAVNYPDGHGNLQTTYDDMGRVVRAESNGLEGTAVWTYTYDSLGHTTRETLAVDGYSWPISYRYDRYGHLDQLTYPDAKRIGYAPNALGQPTQAGGFATRVRYFPDGALEYYALGNGAEYLAERNERQLLQNLTVATGTAFIYSQDLAYDKNANIVSMTDLTEDGRRSKTLSYDALNRLTKAQATKLWGTEAYAYDALNNLRRMNSDGLQRTYQYDSRNLLSGIVSGSGPLHAFTYDAVGNNTIKDGQTRVFSTAHRLLQVPGVASYLYDAAGRRVKMTTAAGDTTYYAYSQAGQLLYQEDGASGKATDYVYLGKKLVGRIERSKGDAALNPPGISIDTNPNNGSYNLGWTQTNGTGISYTLEEQANGGGWHQIYSGTANHHAVSGKAGGDYRYRVKVCKSDCSDWGLSAAVGVTPAKPVITIPSGLQSARYTVKWTKPASTTKIDVQEQVDGGSWSSITCNNACTSISLPGDRNGNYIYRVRAGNSHGNRGWVTSGTVTVLLPPGKAPSLTVPETSSTWSFTVKWGSVASATSYTVQVRKNNGSWGSLYSGSAHSKSVTSGTNGAHYGYRVKACNDSGCGPWSSTKITAVAVPPEKPADVHADHVVISPKMETITVNWKAVSGITKYAIKNIRTGSVIWSGTALSHQVEDGGPPLSMDDYAVHACNQWACSAWAVASRREIEQKPTSAPALSVPAGSASGSYKVSWETVYRAASYILQERKDGGSWHEIYKGGGLSKSFEGKAGAAYGYRVQACNGGGCGPWSTIQTVTVLYPPGIPGGISVPSSSNGSLTVSWTASSTATSYTLRQSIDGASYTTAYTGSSRSRALSVSKSGSYRYAVKACNSSGCSGYRYSTYVAVTVPPASAPSLSAPGTDSDGSYTVSWGSVSGATSYTLQQQVNGGSWSTQYSGSGRSKAYSGMTNGARYGYRIRACNASGCGPWSGTKTTAIAIPPAKPTSVYADHVVITPNMETLTVNWKAVSGITKYEIKNIRTGGVLWSGTTTSHLVDDGKPPLSLDDYAVHACNKWACSAWVVASRREVVQKPTVAPSLSAPSGSASGSYKVSWGTVYRAASFTLQERTNSGSWRTVYSGSGRSKSFSGKADAIYGYRVRASNSGGSGPWSGIKTTEVAKVPAVPTGLTVSMSGPSYKPVVHVSWKAAARASRYDLEVTRNGGAPQTRNAGNTTSTSSLEMGGGEIQYRVRGCNGVGCSSWSGARSILLPPGNGGPGPFPLSTPPDTEPSAAAKAAMTEEEDQA